MEQEDIKYFQKQKNLRNPIFFNRFPDINFDNLKILDLGCGHGALSIDLALKGAMEVIGLDLDANRVKFANKYLNSNYPDLKDKITFKCVDLKELYINDFDMIISKASFEHVLDLDILLVEMKNKLKIGGKIVTGFGPLYNSPWGDHNRLRHKLPWMHILLGNKYFINKLNKNRKDKITHIHDLGLNGYSLKRYRHIFNNTKGLSVVDFRTNVSHKSVVHFFNLFTYFSFTREFFTYNIYCVLKRVK